MLRGQVEGAGEDAVVETIGVVRWCCVLLGFVLGFLVVLEVVEVDTLREGLRACLRGVFSTFLSTG